MTKKRNQFSHDPTVDDHLNLIIATVSKVWQSPDSVHQDVDVCVVYQHGQGRQDLLQYQLKNITISSYFNMDIYLLHFKVKCSRNIICSRIIVRLISQKNSGIAQENLGKRK